MRVCFCGGLGLREGVAIWDEHGSRLPSSCKGGASWHLQVAGAESPCVNPQFEEFGHFLSSFRLQGLFLCPGVPSGLPPQRGCGRSGSDFTGELLGLPFWLHPELGLPSPSCEAVRTQFARGGDTLGAPAAGPAGVSGFALCLCAWLRTPCLPVHEHLHPHVRCAHAHTRGVSPPGSQPAMCPDLRPGQAPCHSRHLLVFYVS